MFGFLSDLLFCSYDNGRTLNFDIKLLRTEKKSVNRHIFFSQEISLVVLCIKGDLEFVIVVGHLEIHI